MRRDELDDAYFEQAEAELLEQAPITEDGYGIYEQGDTDGDEQ